MNKKNRIIIDDSSSVESSNSVFSIDLDGDGDKDLITGSFNKLVWQKNIDGLGNYGSLINIDAQGSNVFSIDIDGDNDNDILSLFNRKIKVYKNNGLGEFNEVLIVTNSTDEDGYQNDNFSSSGIYSSDIDGDGLNDIITFSNENAFVWYKNIDGNNFADSQIIFSVFEPEYIYSNDIDNDGDMDIIGVFKEIVSGGSIYNRIRWFENLNGLGTNWTQRLITTQHVLTDGLISPLTIDIDNDGDLDIIYGKNDYENSRLVLRKNNGNGSFNSEQYLTTAINMIGDICLTDINNDNLLDIVTTSADWQQKINWYENLGSDNFSSQNEIGNNIGDATSVISSDLNNDGKIDIVYSSSNKNDVAWYKNLDSQGSFDIRKSTMTIADYPYFTTSFDLDNDGDLDVISLSEIDHKLAWYENLDGHGTFGLQKIIKTGWNFKNIIMIDIDNDNDGDIITCRNHVISMFKNDGMGSFDSEQIIANFNFVDFIYEADIDGDDKFDIVAISTNKISWFKNLDNLGNFSNEQIISSDGSNSIFCADFDDDGDLDIVSCSISNDNIKWFENIDGLGNFGSEQIISTMLNPIVVYSYDIDDDGDLDVLSASKSDHKIVWYENTNNLGGFGIEQIISSDFENQVRNLKVMDIDNDGVNEILSNTDNYIHVFVKNASDTSFTRQRVNQNAIYYIDSMHLADVDNDGDIDIISCVAQDDLIDWYKNLSILGNEINGNVKLDFNVDGCDNSDINISNLLIETSNGLDDFATFTQNNGDYLLYTNEGNFITSVTTNLPNYYTINPNSETNTFTGFDNTFTANFCIEPNQTVNDVNINLIPTSQARPGFNATYQIVYKNVGTTQLNGNVTLEFDNTKLSFLNASETVNTQTSNSLTFNYSNLNPFETRTIDLEFNVFAPPTVNIDDILNFTTTINPIASDFTADDNIFTFNQTVIGSFDPNDITCLEGNQILLADADKYLHYVIRFQNTGTASAINVVVTNDLDTNLDWSTLQLESLSHNNRVAIKNGNEIEFIFENINLPDSTTDEPNSHGFITYKIKPKTDIALGDIIPNKADIFFDFNEAIETNTATTTIVNVLAVNENTLLDFSVYPTPTESILNVKSKTEIIKIEIYSKLGQLIIKSKTENQIDVSNLTQGLYFVKVEDINGKFGVKKIVKK